MLDRFDLRPVLRGLDQGLRHRRQFGDEPVDVGARKVLRWVPLVVLTLSIALQLVVRTPGQLTTAFSLMSSALLSAFALIARWRETLSAREHRTDDVPKRALDEAVAHILVCSVLGVVGAVVTAAMSTFTVPYTPRAPMHWVGCVMSGGVLAIGTRLALQFVIVVHLLWEQYERVNKPSNSKPYPKEQNTRRRA